MGKQGAAVRSSESAHNLSVAPLEVRCEHMIPEPDGGSHRCTRWFVLGPNGETDRKCVAHSEAPHAIELRSNRRKQQQESFGAEAARKRKMIAELVPDKFRSFSDIEAARNAVTRAVMLEDISAAAGAIALRSFAQSAEQIKDLGETIEGGRGFLRLMPGMQLVEQLDDSNRSMTMKEAQIVVAGTQADIQNGVKPPVTWHECWLRYLGIERAPEMAYDAATHEPIGEFRIVWIVDAKTRKKTTKRVFVPFASVEFAKKRVAEEAKRRSGS